ncbi:MAG: hypothetical protein HYS26_02025 [Candidatus Kaiserbacteria bacterium]|nr:MAG: hypothetical protein HYS26_02025 [Candidatus Kaiserbacteria bacterium]
MDDFLKMDIFFVVTTLVVLAFGVVFGFILVRIYRILGYLEEISKELSAEAKDIRSDVQEVRASVRTFLQRIFRRRAK